MVPQLLGIIYGRSRGENASVLDSNDTVMKETVFVAKGIRNTVANVERSRPT